MLALYINKLKGMHGLFTYMTVNVVMEKQLIEKYINIKVNSRI